MDATIITNEEETAAVATDELSSPSKARTRENGKAQSRSAGANKPHSPPKATRRHTSATTKPSSEPLETPTPLDLNNNEDDAMKAKLVKQRMTTIMARSPDKEMQTFTTPLVTNYRKPSARPRFDYAESMRMRTQSGSSAPKSGHKPSARPPSSPVMDESHHFFSIETRMELKERVAELQKRLEKLLIRTKIAWMKCFAHGLDAVKPKKTRQRTEERENQLSHDALQLATSLVDKGEELASHLHLAILKARSNGPIDEFKKLVEFVEIEMLDFERLVEWIARTDVASPKKSKPPPSSSSSSSLSISTDSRSTPTSAESTPGSVVSTSASMPHLGSHVSIDLPSMKQYCAKVAPPYAAYLKPIKKK